MLFIYQGKINKRHIEDVSSQCLGNGHLSLPLIGIPGHGHGHVWLCIPICLMYLMGILGNGTTLVVIRTEPSLHEPVSCFLSMSAPSDLGLSPSALPTTLRTSLFKATGISADACAAQEFFTMGSQTWHSRDC